MIEKILVAKAPGKLGKKPKAVVGQRKCDDDECITVLSMYNKEKHCWRHQPRKAPRLRGSPVETVVVEVSCLDCMDKLADVIESTTEIWLGATLHWRVCFHSSTICSLPCGPIKSESSATN